MSKPSFLQNIGDTEEEQSLLSALGDTEESTEPTEPTQSTETANTQTPNETPEQTTTPQPTEEKATTPEGDGASNPDPTTKESDEKPEVQADIHNDGTPKPEEPKDGGNQNAQQLIFGKYKTIEDAEKGFKELESVFSKAQQKIKDYQEGRVPVETSDKPSDVQRLKSAQVVFPQKIKTEDYLDSEGNLRVDEYMDAREKNLIMAFQHSLVGGGLASVQFGLLKRAMQEEHDKLLTQNKFEEETQSITNKLYEAFPILNTNSDLEMVVSNAILGEKYNRVMAAKQNNTTPAEMTYDDYYKIISKIISNQASTGAQPQDIVETPKSTPTLNAGTPTQRSEVEDIVEGMSRVNKRGSIF